MKDMRIRASAPSPTPVFMTPKRVIYKAQDRTKTGPQSNDCGPVLLEMTNNHSNFAVSIKTLLTLRA